MGIFLLLVGGSYSYGWLKIHEYSFIFVIKYHDQGSIQMKYLARG